jgi:rod shape determining protein RodA
MVLLLIGLFFVPAIQNVHRWYRIPFLGMAVQPSECAKLIVVIALSWFLENRAAEIRQSRATWQGILIVLIPFFLILKQPDLDSALFFGGIKKRVVATMSALALAGVLFVTLMFLGVLSHDGLRPYFTKVIKEYQYERFSPNTYHQKAAQTAIALGGVTGSGWHKSEFTGRQWLPAAHTDSNFVLCRRVWP